LAKKVKTYRVEGVVDLPDPLFLASDFLGLLKPATIGGVAVHVVLPGVSESGDETVLHSRALVDWVGSFAEKKGEDNPRWPFGEVNGWGDERELSATRLLVIPKSRLTLREARSLHDAAEAWVQLLGVWIDVVAHTDLHQERIKEDKWGHRVYVWVERGKDGGELLKGRHTLTFNFDNLSLPISPWQWGKILKAASSGINPPEAHLFLRDARRELGAQRYRRSVLDAATAAEIALTKLRDDALAGSDPHMGEYVREKAQQIGRLVEFLCKQGRKLPDRIQQEIAEPRNRAIHEGREPDEGTATKALEKAEEVLDLAFPWKKLL
jgi:HEPN domain-containing protein